MNTIRRLRLLTLLILGLGPIASPPVPAARPLKLKIVPGPKVISAEEMALQADPSAGTEHGVILLEETDRDESARGETELRYHLRAKIFSSEGRDLANIQLPVFVGQHRLKKWWGRTILPDGEVLELKRKDLDEQFLVKLRRKEVHAIRAALPGVVPGCVIDYGYSMHWEGKSSAVRVLIQKPWPVKEFRYRWIPSGWHPGSYALSGPSDLRIEIERRENSLIVSGHDLPAVPWEPMMPPQDSMRAAMTFYYPREPQYSKSFWKRQAAWLEERLLRVRREHQQQIADLVEEVGGEEGLVRQLKAAYTRMVPPAPSAESRNESTIDLDVLFIGVARSLGAYAYLVLATDRTERLWNPQLKMLDQFDARMVALSLDGKLGKETIFVDPGSGLDFGEIPWWVTGWNAFVATPSGGGSIFLPPSDARNNKSHTEARIAFSAESDTATATWTIKNEGQVGLRERHVLLDLRENEKQEFVHELCRSGQDVDLIRADVQSLGTSSRSLELSCDAEILWLQAPDEQTGNATYSLKGPWLSELPSLLSGPRTFPVVFDYPRVDFLELTVSSPPGYGPGEPPEPILITSPYGRYELSVSRALEGYRVERAFGLVPLSVPAAEYDALIQFLADVRRADDARLEFRRAASSP